MTIDTGQLQALKDAVTIGDVLTALKIPHDTDGDGRYPCPLPHHQGDGDGANFVIFADNQACICHSAGCTDNTGIDIFGLIMLLGLPDNTVVEGSAAFDEVESISMGTGTSFDAAVAYVAGLAELPDDQAELLALQQAAKAAKATRAAKTKLRRSEAAKRAEALWWKNPLFQRIPLTRTGLGASWAYARARRLSPLPLLLDDAAWRIMVNDFGDISTPIYDLHDPSVILNIATRLAKPHPAGPKIMTLKDATTKGVFGRLDIGQHNSSAVVLTEGICDYLSACIMFGHSRNYNPTPCMPGNHLVLGANGAGMLDQVTEGVIENHPQLAELPWILAPHQDDVGIAAMSTVERTLNLYRVPSVSRLDLQSHKDLNALWMAL